MPPMPSFYEFFAGGGMARAGLGSSWTCLFANDFDHKKGLAYQANWGTGGELKVGDDVQIITQYKDMRQAERDETLDVFKNDLKQTNLAFFVMGGMFAEGIDYVGDMLHGVIVVGVGLPMLSDVNQQLKDYYDQTFSKGFDYAYTYPGMNKVIQAVGRVIRRDDDYGVAILIDDRFTTHTYKKLFPLEWKSYEIIKENTLLKK